MDNYSFIRAFDVLIEGLFFGFALSVFISYLLTLTKKESLVEFHGNFLNNSIKVIRVVGIIFLLYFLYLLVKNFDSIKSLSSSSDDFVITLFFLFRYLLIVFLTQLFWFKSVLVSKFKKTIIIFLIFGLSLFATFLIEKYFALTIDYHRDFVPQSLENKNSTLVLLSLIFSIVIEKIFIFSSIVLVFQLIMQKMEKSK